jgi:hypothetical protein
MPTTDSIIKSVKLWLIENLDQRYLYPLLEPSNGIPQTIPGFPVEIASVLVALPDFRKQVPPSKSVLQEN